MNLLVKMLEICRFLILFPGSKWEKVFKKDVILYDNFVRDL